MYDFKEHKIGLIESVTSRMLTQKASANQTSKPSATANEDIKKAAGD